MVAAAAGARPDADDDVGDDRRTPSPRGLTRRTKHDKKHFGPPQFVVDAQAELHRRLTGIFEQHRDELAVEPEVAAVALRSLIFGASRPELGMNPALSADQIADLLLSAGRHTGREVARC